MACVLRKIGLQIILTSLLLYEVRAQRITPKKEELIQDTVRKFLGVKSDDRTAVPGKSQSLPPQYMMDLYEKYRSGQTPMQGNTVRSILAMQDTINKVDMLIFNLTGLKSTEQILQSKLYLLKRRRPKGGKKREHATFRLTIGCLPDMPSKRQIDISLARQKPEWHSYDISESVVSCRQIRRGNESLLGLTLDVKRSKGRFKSVAFKRLVKPNSQPFVLIFSEDSHNQSSKSSMSRATEDPYGEIGDLLRAKANQEGFLPENLRPFQSLNRTHRHRDKRSSNNDSRFDDANSLGKFEVPSLVLNSDTDIQRHINDLVESFDLYKKSRSDFVTLLTSTIENIRYSLNVNKQASEAKISSTNEEYRKNFFNNSELLKNSTFSNLSKNVVLFSKTIQLFIHPNSSGSHKTESPSNIRTKRTLSDTLRYSTETKESHISEPTVKTIQVMDDNYIKRQSSEAFPKPRRRKGKRKGHQNPRKTKKKRRRNRKLPFWWTRHDSRLHSQEIKQLCRRKSLMVDFTQLGWDDWIISPKSFNAHYCEGSCTFPIIKHTETSNHAAVQSLIHAMGLNPDIPTPSCVPSATSSLTLLYFDEHGGLVLKSYPNMIVEKCGCR